MLTYGFYNSVNRDRRYDAEQIGAMFDGLITDGVFANYKSALNVTAGPGRRELIINPGKAWFNGTWTTVDDGCHSIYLMGSAVETTYFVYLTVNKAERVNTIAWYSSERFSDPGTNVYYYLLAQVTVPGGVDEIQQSMIVDTRGSDLCPYVTGILETVSFEEIVREVCGDNWQMWLDEYSEAINATVNEAAENANTALALARRTSSDVTESNDSMYTWAQYATVPTGAASYNFERAADDMTSVAPPQRKLFWGLTFDGNTITLVNPLQKTPATAQTQLENWKRYKYFYGDGLDGATDNAVYRYDELSVVYDGGTSNPVGVYTVKTSKAVVDPAPVVAGDYIGVVVADSPFTYPKNGPSGEYWYVRFSARAEYVFFDDSELSLSARTVQEAIKALAKSNGSGSAGGEGTSAYVASDEPPADTRFLWINTAEPDEAVALGVTAVETDEGVDLYCTDELGTIKVTVRNGKDGNGSGGNVALDTTLTQSGQAADAKAVGDALTGKVAGIGITTIMAITQAEYDELVMLEQVDDQTLYIIKPESEDSPDLTMIPVLRSDGTAYIDLGVAAPAGAWYEVCFRGVTDMDQYDAIFGNTHTMVGTAGGGLTNTWVTGYYAGSSYAVFGKSSIDLSTKHVFKVTNSALILDGDTENATAIAAGAVTYKNPLYLFAINRYVGDSNNINNATNISAIDLFYLRIWSSEDKLLHNYVPAKDSEGVACIYDTVDKAYLYNAAESGAFEYREELEES